MALVLLAGCSGHESTGPSPHPSASPTAPLQAPPAVDEPGDQDQQLASPAPSPTWDPASRAAALAAATTAMTAYARPGVDPTTWWNSLSPLLTATAATAYAGTDPRNVPVHALTGLAALTDDSSAYLAPVQVPTDVGTYRVLLSRAGAGSPWLVERFMPPAPADS